MYRIALSVVLVLGLASGTVSAAESATIWGLVLDGAGHPAPGYAVTIQDVASGATWTSPASSPAGQYQIPVPVGSSYRTVGVVTLGGARFSLDPGVPVQARRAVRYRLDVQLPGTTPTSANDAGQPRASAPGPGADDRAPWWKSPAGITGLVVVQGAVLAIVLMNNDDDEIAASPSSP